MMRTTCPNCECEWGIEEMDWNKCSCCGWPDNDEEEDFTDDEQDLEGIILPPHITILSNTKFENMMPIFLGEPWYPFGHPIGQDQIFINNESLQKIVLRYYEGEATTDEEKIIKEFVLYYIGAPYFDIQFDDALQAQNFKLLPLDDILDVLLDAGIDPL